VMRRRHVPPKAATIASTQPQLVLAAMNIIAEHEAGGDVAPVRLKGARDYLALWERVRATSAPPARALPKEAA
jgi:hypothetical protein